MNDFETKIFSVLDGLLKLCDTPEEAVEEVKDMVDKWLDKFEPCDWCRKVPCVCP